LIAVDASVLIAALAVDDAFSEEAIGLLQRHAGQPFAASVITMAEVLVAPARAGVLERTWSLLERMRVTSVGLADESIIELARLRARTNLKLPDCCVLHAAQRVGAERVLTFDARTAASARELGLAA